MLCKCVCQLWILPIRILGYSCVCELETNKRLRILWTTCPFCSFIKTTAVHIFFKFSLLPLFLPVFRSWKHALQNSIGIPYKQMLLSNDNSNVAHYKVSSVVAVVDNTLKIYTKTPVSWFSIKLHSLLNAIRCIENTISIHWTVARSGNINLPSTQNDK